MLPDYATIKHMHMGAVALSFALFVLRGIWMLWSPDRLRMLWVRFVPHAIDTVLLATALLLAWHLGAAAASSWIVAKVVGLLVYIALGIIALKRGRTRRIRAVAFVGAIVAFVYIVMVAVTKSPLGVMA